MIALHFESKSKNARVVKFFEAIAVWNRDQVPVIGDQLEMRQSFNKLSAFVDCLSPAQTF